ncbi:MAG TPA: GH1 family beta-glucosidase [Kineosporiaceae bacterium]|nr:GH1 family beta-glucosidase [Kineosporiaceae bacterium]
MAQQSAAPGAAQSDPTDPTPPAQAGAGPQPATGDAGQPGQVDLSGLGADFVWGAATSSFQIEGDADGRGRSIWDDLCDVPGAITDGSHGRTACDHVHRYAEDVRLMRDLGVGAYRFSIAWPRVMPSGTGRPDPAGLAFYDRLVDELLAAGISPWVTLYHWDLPSPLQTDLGGWASREIVPRFADYAVAVHAALGDRVRHWATLNEPWCSAWLGYGSGEHAPGIRDHGQAARAAHHLLLAHGEAIRAMRAQAPADHELGIVLNLFPLRPSPRLTGREAAEVGEITRLMDGVQNRWWLDALFEGHYPRDVTDRLSAALDGVVRDGDLERIGAPLDFLGVNYYSDQYYLPAQQPGPADSGAYPGAALVTSEDPGPDATTMGWPVTPDGLHDILLRIGRAYPAAPPLVVTENGAAYPDDPAAVAAAVDGTAVADPMRVRYLRAHLAAVARAVRDGADVRGYFAWSLLDNFEWAHGYTQRFGLVRVDFDSLQRRPRRSYEVYRDAIAAHRGGFPRD